MTPRLPRVVSDRRGAALMTVMLLVLLLLVAIVGAFTRTTTERRTAMDATAQVDAFSIAQSGIDQYLIAHTAVPGTLPDSATYTVTGGRAVVTLRYFRKSAVSPIDTILLVTSRGEVTNDRYNATAPRATRTVSQMVRFAPGFLDVRGALVSLTGFDINGNSATYSGVDNCTTAPGPLASIPGLSVPSVSGSPGTADATANPGFNVIDGNPDNTPAILGTPGSTGTAKDTIGIDWAGISQRTSVTPDYYQKTVSPTISWTPSDPSGASASSWPLVFVQGDYTGKFPNNGQGIFVVTGNVTLTGTSNWNGIVLIGGNFTSNGTTTVLGATYTGLNVTVPAYNPPNAAQAAFPVPGRESVGNGTKLFQYDSCSIKKALSQFGDWSRLGNAWTDNWPSY